jgi:hypothetical protein
MKPFRIYPTLSLLLVLVIALALLPGCQSAATRNEAARQAYGDLVIKREKSAADARKEVLQTIGASAVACNGDARCVEHIASMAALAYVGGGAGVGLTPIPPPQREPSAAEKFASFAGAISPILGTLATGAVQWHQADTSRDVSRAQYSFLGGVVHDTASAAAAMQPNVSVGGDYIAGDGNTAVRGHVGDAIGGSVVGGDQIGRDRTDNSGVIHTGDGDRYGSDGPYTGPICSGDTCQPTDSGNTGGGDPQPSGG